MSLGNGNIGNGVWGKGGYTATEIIHLFVAFKTSLEKRIVGEYMF